MGLLFFSTRATPDFAMPTPPKLTHAPSPASDETPGQRLAVSIEHLPAHPRTTVRKCLDLMPQQSIVPNR